VEEKKILKEHNVTLMANEGIFRGLAKQNMIFHQCIGELIDNSIAAKRENEKFRVDVIFNKKDASDSVEIYIADNSKGMPLEIFMKALQLGESATTEDRLNEHGFGMKNALATLSGENGYWRVWTKPIGEDTIFATEGPFRPDMIIREEESFPEVDFLPTDFSTLIKVSVKMSFIQTVQGRGAPSKDLATLRTWLIEHLGVSYRGYLEQDAVTYEHSGTIVVSIGNDSLQVTPISIPLGDMKTEYIEVELDGQVYKLEYRYGTLDEVKRDVSVRGDKTKYYYQGNVPTQGIDIRLGKRTIATRQFETIWKTEDKISQLSRHNNYNDFLGELLIPEVPRGTLATVNNKTDFNLDDDNWTVMFDKINDIRPPKNIREKSEKELQKKWMDMLKATNPDDEISSQISVWPTATKIDVYRKTSNNKIIIYELKVGNGAPLHLYQLKMYWDGLVISGQQPREAFLFVEDFNTNLEEMANQMNKLPSPFFPTIEEGKTPVQSKSYNFKIVKHTDKGL
jgi:hypothetical protein